MKTNNRRKGRKFPRVRDTRSEVVFAVPIGRIDPRTIVGVTIHAASASGNCSIYVGCASSMPPCDVTVIGVNQ